MNAFTGQNLAEKLSKLNSSQQSIETLSHWCIFHRKKARQVVETWEREFYEAPREQRLPFLYLANDILQNGKKKGSEFVTEFWKVLPNALRDVIENSGELARNSAFRLIDIWEERKVFGSRPHSLRDELLGSKAPQASMKGLDAPPTPSKPRIFAGGYLDKVAAALQVVQDGSKDEEATLAKCNNAISDVDSLEKEAQFLSSPGEGDETVILDELEKQQIVLSQCAEQLEAYEKSRDVLVQQIKEILHEQERKLESIRTSVQIAQAQAEQAGSLRHRIITGSPIGAPAVSPLRENGSGDDLHDGSAMMNQHHESMSGHEDDKGGNLDMSEPMTNVSIAPSASPLRLLERTPSLEDEGKQVHQNPASTAAAEVAARLAANASSAAMLTSVLSSLAAQESTALGHSSPLNQQQFHEGLLGGGHHVDKRPRLDTNVSMGEVVGHSPTDGSGQSSSYMQHQPNANSQAHSGHQHSSGGVQQQQTQPPPPPNSQHQQLHKQIPGPPPLPQYLQGGQGQVQIIPPGPPPPSQYSYSGGPGMSVMQAPPHPSLLQGVTGGPRMQQAPLPPGLNPPPNSFQPLQPPAMVGFYSQPPLPAPPAPVPRQ